MKKKVTLLTSLLVLACTVSVVASYYDRFPVSSTNSGFNDLVHYDGWKFEEGTEVTISYSLTEDLLNEEITATLTQMETGEKKQLVLSTHENNGTAFVNITQTGTYQFAAAAKDGRDVTDKVTVTYRADVSIPMGEGDGFILL